MESNFYLRKLLTRSTFILMLFFNLMVFSLGAGVAHYFGANLNWMVYLISQFICLFLMMFAYFLNEYFDTFSPSPELPAPRNESELVIRRKIQSTLLVTALVMATISTTLVVQLGRIGYLNPTVSILILAGFLACIAYSVPPIRLVYSGAGEIVLVFMLTLAIPAISYSIFAGDLHRYILLLSMPLSCFLLASLLVQQFSSYSSDCSDCRSTLLVRLGWQKGWHLHNILVILGYAFFVFISLQGISWRMLWPILFTLPLAAGTFFLLAQLANGKKPQWKLMQTMSWALIGLTVYLLTFTFWTR